MTVETIVYAKISTGPRTYFHSTALLRFAKQRMVALRDKFMHTNDYLFPHRLTRRDFVKLTATAAAGLALPQLAEADDSKTPARIGSGKYTYQAVPGWGELP